MAKMTDYEIWKHQKSAFVRWLHQLKYYQLLEIADTMQDSLNKIADTIKTEIKNENESVLLGKEREN